MKTTADSRTSGYGPTNLIHNEGTYVMKQSMKQSRLKNFLKAGLYVSALGVAVGISTPGLADTSVWEVKSDSNTVYLGGTVHMLRMSDYPLPPEYEQAYQAASHIYFETDLDAMNDMSVQQIMRELTYQDERSLKTVLNEEAYTALLNYTDGLGLALTAMEKSKPGWVITGLQVWEFQRIGFTPQGVDAYFNTRAIGDAKSRGQLETLAEHLSLLASMGEGNESEFILYSLKDFRKTKALLEDVIQAWREGDNDKLSDMLIDNIRNELPQLYDSLLRQRNLNWIPQIEQMLSDGDTEFVLVGAAHLVGSEGLLTLLRDRGYQVRQL